MESVTSGNDYMRFLVEILCTLPMDWNLSKLKFNTFPATVDTETKLVKVHFLFQMLGVGVIFVVNHSNQLKGTITREQFLNFRYQTNLKDV